MAGLYAVEIEPEVRSWLEHLSDRDFRPPAHDTFDREAS